MEEQTNKSKGGQPGNNNATKNKPFYDAIRRALVQNPHKMANIVDKVIEKAEEGEAWAVKEIADRLDGKAVQATTFEDAEGNNVTTSLEVRFHAPLIAPSVDE